MSKILIGIDPDVNKNGVAIIKNGILRLEKLTFFELYNELSFYKEREVKPIVYVEAGYLNKSNWHLSKINNIRQAALIGNKVGRNHETARKIVEMCQYLNLPFVEVKPTSKKVTEQQFRLYCTYRGKVNQEQIDAFMLIAGR